MIKRFFSYVLVIGLLGILISRILENRHLFYLHKWDFSLSKVLPIIILLLFFYPLVVFSWHLILKSLKVNINYKTNFRIWMMSNLVRFLPGSIWQYPSRVYLLDKAGVSKSVTIEALIIEGLLNIAAASLLFIMSLLFWQLPEQFTPYKFILIIPSLFPLLIFGLVNKKFMVKIIKFLSRFKKINPKLAENLSFSFWQILVLLGCFILQLTVGGLILFFLSSLLLDLNYSLAPIFVGVYSFSWLMGYLVVIAPGGLGVSDSIMALLLSNFMPFALGATIALALRVVILLGEFCSLPVAFFLGLVNNQNNGK